MFQQRTGNIGGGQIGWLRWLLNPRGCYGDGTAAGNEEGAEGCCLEGSSVWSPSKGDDVLRSVCLASRSFSNESAVLSGSPRQAFAEPLAGLTLLLFRFTGSSTPSQYIASFPRTQTPTPGLDKFFYRKARWKISPWNIFVPLSVASSATGNSA